MNHKHIYDEWGFNPKTKHYFYLCKSCGKARMVKTKMGLRKQGKLNLTIEKAKQLIQETQGIYDNFI